MILHQHILKSIIFAFKIRDRFRTKFWQIDNPEKVYDNRASWAEKNPEKIKNSKSIWMSKNPNSGIEWARSNPAKRKVSRRKWATNHPGYHTKYMKVRCEKDLYFRLQVRLRSRLYKAVKNNYKSGSAIRDLGCSIEFLKAYLERQFKPGMCWETYGEWHIDHIRPLSSFDLLDPEQFRLAVHYTNLQPMWEEDNLKKGARHEQ